MIASSRGILELAAFGLPLTDSISSAVVDFLSAVETANRERIPRAHVTDRLGWVTVPPGKAFLLPDMLVEAVNSDMPNADSGTVRFVGRDAGDRQIVSNVARAGDMAEWQAAIAPLNDYPQVMLGLYASLAAPLLEQLGVPGFALSYSGPTSGGKTTVQRIGASCWGQPSVEGGYLLSWDSTRVGIERAMSILHHLPVIVDDTSRIRNADDLRQVAFDVAAGRGRTRGTTTGLAPTGSWRTIMISSGESPCTSLSEAGGARARVLELWGGAVRYS